MYQNSSLSSLILLNDGLHEEDPKENLLDECILNNEILDLSSTKLSLYLSDSQLSSQECCGNIAAEDNFILNPSTNIEKRNTKSTKVSDYEVKSHSCSEKVSNCNSKLNNTLIDNRTNEQLLIDEMQTTKKSIGNDFDEKIRLLILKTERVKRKIDLANSSIQEDLSKRGCKRRKLDLKTLKKALSRLSYSFNVVQHQRATSKYVKTCNPSNVEVIDLTQEQNENEKEMNTEPQKSQEEEIYSISDDKRNKNSICGSNMKQGTKNIIGCVVVFNMCYISDVASTY